jgi:hypothetical protein
MPSAEELLAQLGIVEQLAVERHPDRLILVGDRLPAAGDVDDRESSHTQGKAGFDVEVFIIRTAVGNRPGHGEEPVFREETPASQVQRAHNAAHVSRSIFRTAPSPAELSARMKDVCTMGQRLWLRGL